MDKLIFKASILIEALPYIKEFYNQTVVIKYGGAAMEDDKLKEMVLTDIALMKYVGIKPVIVHGGGKDITSLADKLGQKTEFLNGYRVTDKNMMEITEMVLTGKLNKDIVSHLNRHKVKAIGISGRDSDLIIAKSKGPEYGYVGDIVKINPKIIFDLENNGYVPVISPIATNENGEAMNINADIAASEIAKALKAKKLVLLTDVDGIYLDIKKPETLFSTLKVSEARRMIDEKIIVSGMLPKISACMTALEEGVEKIHIINGKIIHSLLLEVFTTHGIGTQIIHD
ncbi:MAG: acetylglutamate kinase [Spirochaetes bacterium GWB1_36_13]|nr:MAG: acetylglutamate kinase [Spirochaetes bacterium GWB1_36_13]